MALPKNTSTLIQFLRPGIDPNNDYFVLYSEGDISIDKYSGSGVVPTEQELIDANNDLTTVDHGMGAQTFSQWSGFRGQDQIKTKRMKALQTLLRDDGLRVLLRGLSYILQDELRNLKKSTPLPNRSLSDLEQELKTAILSGEGDDPA